MKPFRCVVEPGQKTAELKLYCSHGRSFRCRATEDVNKTLRDGACRIMLCFLGAALLLALENKVCICLRVCTALLSGKESNELKARKVDPGHLAQFPATLRALGRAMGHSQEVVCVCPPALGQEGLAAASSQDQGLLHLLVYV